MGTKPAKKLTRGYQVDVAAVLARNTPGALVYQRAVMCEEVVLTSTTVLGEQRPPEQARRDAQLLIMVQHAKNRPLDRLLERLRLSLMPLVAGGADEIASARIQALVSEATQEFPTLHVAVMSITMPHTYAWIHGGHRIYLLRDGRGRMLSSNREPWQGRISVSPDDTLIALSPSAVDTFTAAAAAKASDSAIKPLAHRIAQEAVRLDPLSHHAVVTMRMPLTTAK